MSTPPPSIMQPRPTAPNRLALFTRAGALAIALPLLVGLALPMGGCKSRGGSGSVDGIDPVSTDQRIAQAQGFMQQGDQQYKNNQIDDAIESYKQAILAYNDLPMAWNNLGLLLVKRNKDRDRLAAVECFKTAADQDRTDPRPVANIGAVYHEMSYLDDAAKWYSQALERDPNFWPALVNSIAVDHLRDHRGEDTAERIRRALLRTDDPQWTDYLKRQKEIVEGRLAETRKPLGQ